MHCLHFANTDTTLPSGYAANLSVCVSSDASFWGVEPQSECDDRLWLNCVSMMTATTARRLILTLVNPLVLGSARKKTSALRLCMQEMFTEWWYVIYNLLLHLVGFTRHSSFCNFVKYAIMSQSVTHLTVSPLPFYICLSLLIAYLPLRRQVKISKKIQQKFINPKYWKCCDSPGMGGRLELLTVASL